MATPMEMVMETDGAMYVKLDPSGKVRVRVCLPLIYCWSQCQWTAANEWRYRRVQSSFFLGEQGTCWMGVINWL